MLQIIVVDYGDREADRPSAGARHEVTNIYIYIHEALLYYIYIYGCITTVYHISLKDM